ncbi:MotA/TolQ/ExbB proton channel family protein [Labilibaculum euxinus]
MIIRFFYEGGAFFMSLVYLMWIAVFTLAVRFVILYRSNKNPQKLKRTNDSILFFGSFAFLIGITGQMVGLVAAFDIVRKVGNAGVTPQYLAGGLKVTFIAPLIGLLLFMISAIIWFVFRNLKQTSHLQDS